MERFLEGLLGEGNQVRVLLDDDHSRRAGATRPLDALRAEHPGPTCAELPSRTDPWRTPSDAIRRRLQYLQARQIAEAGGKRQRREKAQGKGTRG